MYNMHDTNSMLEAGYQRGTDYKHVSQPMSVACRLTRLVFTNAEPCEYIDIRTHTHTHRAMRASLPDAAFGKGYPSSSSPAPTPTVWCRGATAPGEWANYSFRFRMLHLSTSISDVLHVDFDLGC